ncbi:MAG: D-glycero-beta-D-manno-heptose 1-phosphate adenylyltransferase, partial [Myxococcota bacterium]
AIEDVDFITLFDEETASETLRIIMPDFHIKGVEYKNKNLPEKCISGKLGIKTILLGTKKLNSTSDIIKRIKSL